MNSKPSRSWKPFVFLGVVGLVGGVVVLLLQSAAAFGLWWADVEPPSTYTPFPIFLVAVGWMIAGLMLLVIVQFRMPVAVTLESKPMQTERQPNGRRRLLRALVVKVEGEKIEVPEKTDTDFSSIPWFGRFLVRWSKVDIAGVVHDYLYRVKTHRRSEADWIWAMAAMAGDHRANALQAGIAWLSLRVGAWWAWYKTPRIKKTGTGE